MTRVHVVGAAGYAAAELIRIARRHPFGARQRRHVFVEHVFHAGGRSPIGDYTYVPNDTVVENHTWNCRATDSARPV